LINIHQIHQVMKTETATNVPAEAAPPAEIYQLYLREIGQVPLLSREEELALARLARSGDAEARERLIRGNLRLVVKIARDYEGFGLPLLDLISEGNIGLMIGVDRFDPERGAKLSVYASFWIKQSIRRALANQSRVVRLPVYVYQRLFEVKRLAHSLRETLGHEPDDHELALASGMTARAITRYRTAARRPLALDEPLGEDGDGATAADIVPDEAASTPAEKLDRFQMEALLHEVMCDLSPREALILRQRYGLDGAPHRTLEEIASQLGITRERIRQLQNSALGKLRALLAEREPGVPT
jgi:RNA polymerase primary sigma factor